jgi:hypothetical protein
MVSKPSMELPYSLEGQLNFPTPGQYHLTCVIIYNITLCQVILGGEITGRDAAALGVKVLNGACFNATEVKTNIGILQDPGYDEPWLIAMDCPASEYKTRRFRNALAD